MRGQELNECSVIAALCNGARCCRITSLPFDSNSLANVKRHIVTCCIKDTTRHNPHVFPIRSHPGPVKGVDIRVGPLGKLRVIRGGVGNPSHSQDQNFNPATKE